MERSQVQRRLVKSPPELWAELGSEAALGRHLAPFGEIRITRVDPETTVAWEGDRASGTVQISATGWGTQVTLTATPRAGPEPVAVEPEPADVPRGFVTRLFRRRDAPQPTPSAPAAEIPAPGAPTPDPSPPAPGPDPMPPEPSPAPTLQPVPHPQRTVAILEDVLDGLGSAHHRPFSPG